VGELAVRVGLDLVEFGLVVVLGWQEAAVVLIGAVAALSTTTKTTTKTTTTKTTTTKTTTTTRI